jgi:succinyl-CoA synthetase beta subunit
MQFQEYQAKKLLAEYSIPVPRGEVATSANQAGNAAFRLGGRVAVKAQVLGPGRSAAGGVKLTSSDVEAGRYADSLLGSQLVTAGSGPGGVTVRRVLVEQAVNASKEISVGIEAEGSATTVSARAGDGPVQQVAIDVNTGPTQAQADQLAGAIGLDEAAKAPFQGLLQNLARAFRENECQKIHLNPVAVTPQNRLVAINASVVVEDGVLGRHANLVALRNS